MGVYAAGAAAAASLAGGVVGAIGADQQGAAAADNYRYRAMVSMFNSQLAERKAALAGAAAESRAAEHGMETRGRVAGQAV